MAERKLNLDQRRTVTRGGWFGSIPPLVQLFEVPLSRRFPHLFPDGTRVCTMSAAITWLAEHTQRSPRTIRRWIAKIKKAGDGALKVSVRRDKGHSRFFAKHNQAAAFAAYVHLALKLSVRDVHQAIIRNHEALDVSETQLPCCETVRLWLRSASPTFVALALEGQRTYRELMFSELESGLLFPRKDRSK